MERVKCDMQALDEWSVDRLGGSVDGGSGCALQEGHRGSPGACASALQPGRHPAQPGQAGGGCCLLPALPAGGTALSSGRHTGKPGRCALRAWHQAEA